MICINFYLFYLCTFLFCLFFWPNDKAMFILFNQKGFWISNPPPGARIWCTRHILVSPTICEARMCVRDLIYVPGTRYNFRSSRALRQLNRGVHSKTKPTADWLQSHYIHCSKSWVREVLDKSRGIEWHLTIVYLFIYSFLMLYTDHYHKGKSQSQRIILIYYLHYSS